MHRETTLERNPMSPQQSLNIARRYHQGWSTGNYDQSIDLLASNLTVEVPINDYPTADSFAQALRTFGEMVTHVELLSEMANDDQAMILYDMQVTQLGQLRVAEHFTVENGKILKLRQIHDTAPVRAAGLG
jgi:ketosteroid isomerase-like protein